MAFVRVNRVREGLAGDAHPQSSSYFSQTSEFDMEERWPSVQGYDEEKQWNEPRVPGGSGAQYMAEGEEGPRGSYQSRRIVPEDDHMVGAERQKNGGQGAVAEDRSPRINPRAGRKKPERGGDDKSVSWKASVDSPGKGNGGNGGGSAAGNEGRGGGGGKKETVDDGPPPLIPINDPEEDRPSRYTHLRVAEAEGGSQAVRDVVASSVAPAGGQGGQRPQGTKSRYLINPKSSFIRFWDLVTLFLLVYTAIVTPYEVGFLESGSINFLFVFNRMVDCCFLADMFFNFFLPFQDGNGLWIRSHWLIVRRYLRFWFYIDLVSVIPFDMIGLVTGNKDSTSNLRVLRVVRLLRLAKLLRILRAGRMFRRWESVMRIDYALVSLIKFIIIVLAIAHWLACAWHLVAVIEANEIPLPGTMPSDMVYTNWVGNYDFVSSSSGPWSLYLAALYWSVATLSTLGYGDVIPATDGERLFVVVCTIMGASVYAYMIGNVCGIVAGMDEKNTRFFQMMDALNAFMEEKDLSQSLQERLRDYFRFRRHNSNIHDWHMLLTQMSPALRAEVSQHVHARWISKVPVFRDSPPDLVVEMAMCLRNETYSMNEMIIREGDRADKLYIVEKGVVFVNEMIKNKGGTFGTDMIYRVMRRLYNATTLTHTVVLTLSRVSLVAILEDFPVEKRRLRRTLVRYIFREAVISYMRTIKRLQHAGADESMEIESHFNDAVLPIIYDQKLSELRKNHPERIMEIERAVSVVQGCTRRFLVKRAEKLRLAEVEFTRAAFERLAALLETLGLQRYNAALFKEDVTLENITKLTPSDLRAAVGMSLGNAVLLLEAADDLESKPQRAKLTAAASVVEKSERKTSRRGSISHRPLQPSRYGGGGIDDGDMGGMGMDDGLGMGGAGGGGLAGMAALRGGSKGRKGAV